MLNVSARVLDLAFAVADAEAVVVAVVVALALAVCLAFGARRIIAQGESIGGFGAESMHGVHGSCRWAFRWCKSRFWNHDFGVIPCILEHGASD